VGRGYHLAGGAWIGEGAPGAVTTTEQDRARDRLLRVVRGDFGIRRGHPLPYGAVLRRDGINFSIVSHHATGATLVLFLPGEEGPVLGFARQPSSGVAHPGTFRGVAEKIPYLKELGVTAVELMPVTEFEECDNPRRNLLTGEPLRNFWGYQPASFFAPKASYAGNGGPNGAVREFKEMVKALHEAGIE